MSRLLPGLALFARPCRPAARLLLPRAPTPTPTRTLSSLSTLPSIPRPPQPNSTQPTIPRTFPTQSPRPSLLSQIRLFQRTQPLSTSAQNAMRPTYFRDRPPAGQPRRPQQSWWRRFRARFDSLPPNYVVYALIGVNVAVFLMWQYAINSWSRFRDPALFNWMFQNFILSEVNIRAGRLWTLITSCFSHKSGGHIFFNALGLYFIAPACVSLVGPSAFLGLYLAGGIFSALCSLSYQHFSPGFKAAGSEGASGAIYTTLAFYATLFPRSTFLLFFVVPMPAWLLVGGMFGYDFFQAVTGRQSRTDSAGHAGGIVAGVVAGLLFRGRMRRRMW